MKSVTALIILRDSLRTNLTDPYVLAGGSVRGGTTWIWLDEPHTAFKYPQVVITKVDNPSRPIDIGPNYTEHEQLILNIWVYSKNGFKITVGGVEYSNAMLVEYYQGLIKETLKAQFNTLFAAGVKNYKHLNTSGVAYDPDTQLYYGNITCEVAYFNV